MEGVPIIYEQDRVSAIVGTFALTGLTDPGIVITPDNPRMIWQEGANGSIGVALKRTFLGTIVFNLQQESEDNDRMNSIRGQIVAFLIRDNRGRGLCSGYLGLEMDPPMGYARDHSDRVWTAKCSYKKLTYGGNDPAAIVGPTV